jgi:tetratricopeptide (TPR) repeat protein
LAEFIDRLRSLLAGRYGIERELGRGGMATVYLAEDLKHRRPVAIKLLDSELAALLGPERFVREIEIAARLQHPHILPLLDSGADATLFYYVMPFVQGESLRQRLIAERQLSQDEAVHLTTDVAQALDYAHRSGIVHRDIKPENILLVDGQAVVADFGIARAIRASGGEKLTKTGVTLGSPPYMSPEQIAGRADVDGRSDIYALGCVLYEMLAGQAPFTGPSETLAHQHLNLTARPIRELRPTVTPELEAVLTRALAKTPADRFASGAEFAAALAPATRTATPITPGLRPAVPEPSRRFPAMRTALISLAVLAAVAVALLVWRHQAGERALAAAGGANRRWVWVADFEGPAGDPSLAPAAHDLVGAALDESRMFASVPIEQVKIALRNSGRPDTTRVGADLARELAFRSSIPVVVDGRIGKIGSSYGIALRATNAEDGRVIESATGAASSERDLVPVLTRLARQLRQSLGERSDAFRTTASWMDAPTPSFEAFKLYLLGRSLLNRGDSWAALPLLRQAIALDPDFATAWTTLGTAFGNMAQPDSAIAALREALRHPDRLSAVGRLDIQGKIALHDGDTDGMIEAYDAILNSNPSPVERSAALNNKAEALVERGQSEQALELYRKAATVMPIAPTQLVLGNIVDQLIGLHRLSEARGMLPVLKGPSAAMSELELDLADRSWDRAESLATAMQHDAAAPPLGHFIAGSARASVRGARGDIGGALRVLDEVETTFGPKNARARAMIWFSRFSIARALDQSLPEVPAAIRTDLWGIAAFATRAAESGDSIAARRAVASWPESVEAVSRRALGDQVEARLDEHNGHWDRAVSRLRANALGGVRAIPNLERILRTPSRWLMADAFTRLGQPDSAAVYLNLLLEPPAYEPPTLMTRGLLEPFVRFRLVRLYAQMGRLDDAQRQWDIVSATCTRPDPEVLTMLDDTRAILSTARAMGTGK